MTQSTTSVAVLEEFIRRFGNSFYAALARVRLDKLKRAPTPTQQQPQVAAAAPFDISGAWSAGNQNYQITQEGNAFKWVSEGGKERALGTINGNGIWAAWKGFHGTGSAEGRIINRSGQLTIVWDNGAVFQKK